MVVFMRLSGKKVGELEEEFYRKYILDAPLDEQMEFLQEFPEYKEIWEKLSGRV